MAPRPRMLRTALPAHHARANGIRAVWLNVFHLGKMDAVFIAKGEVAQQILERVDPALGEQFGALRAHAFDHAHFRCRGSSSLTLCLYHSHYEHFQARATKRGGTAAVKLASPIRIYRVMVPRPKRGGSRDGDRLTSSDKRALLLWVLAGILGALFAYKYFFRAFPEASVNFRFPARSPPKSAEIRHRPWRERRRLPIHNCLRGGRQRQGLPGAPARATTSQQADVLRAEYLVLDVRSSNRSRRKNSAFA